MVLDSVRALWDPLAMGDGVRARGPTCQNAFLHGGTRSSLKMVAEELFGCELSNSVASGVSSDRSEL